MRNTIIDLQESDAWKIQLTIVLNFIFSKDAQEERAMHSKSNNIKFASYNNTNEGVDELFKSLSSSYQGHLETSMERSELIFDSVQLMYYKYYKLNFRRGGSCTDSPGWIKKKKAMVNLKKKMINAFNLR